MKLKYIFSILALSVVCMTSCSDDNESNETKPTVSSAAVINNGVNIPRNKDITVTFTEDMNPETINSNTFTLSKGDTPVDGVVSYSERTAKFNPSQELEPKEKYVLRLTTDIQDRQGNTLAEEKVLTFTTAGTKEAITPVLLRDAGDFAILAKSTIINNPNSAVTGDVGIYPAAKTYIAGFYLIDREAYSSSTQVTGKIYSSDMATNTAINLMSAVNSMSLAYDDAETRTSPDFFNLDEGTVGSKILTQGVYKWTSSLKLVNAITLSGGRDDVWIFQIDGDLLVKQDVTIILANGAQAKNVFWQVKGEAVAESNAHIEGNILSRQGILLGDGATLNGRALSQTGIILSGNKIVKPQSF
jgi:hypothetical protein